jgi:hypothetical protein
MGLRDTYDGMPNATTFNRYDGMPNATTFNRYGSSCSAPTGRSAPPST